MLAMRTSKKATSPYLPIYRPLKCGSTTTGPPKCAAKLRLTVANLKAPGNHRHICRTLSRICPHTGILSPVLCRLSRANVHRLQGHGIQPQWMVPLKGAPAYADVADRMYTTAMAAVDSRLPSHEDCALSSWRRSAAHARYACSSSLIGRRRTVRGRAFGGLSLIHI